MSQIGANKTSGCAPMTVAFSPPSGMTTYYWDFDNGGSSEDASPNVVFSNPKNPYKVSLRACKTCPVLETIDIQVFPKPSVSMTPIKGCTPLSASIQPNITLPPGVTASSIKYFFGDGNSQTKTPPNLSPANYTYTTPDRVYDLSFEIKTDPTSAGCDHTIIVPAAVETSSITFNWIRPSPSAACAPPLAVNFTHNIQSPKPLVSYEWDFGDGNTSTNQTPTHTYTQSGTFIVRLTVKNEDGCEKTETTSVVIKDNDMTKIISLDTVCLNRNITLDADGNSGLNYMWTLGSGGISFGRPIVDNYSTPGWKTVSVTSFYPGNVCPKTVTKKILAIDPKIEHTVVPRPLCNKHNNFTLTCTNAHLFSQIEWRLHYVRGPGDTPLIQILGNNMIQSVSVTLPLDTITWRAPQYILMARANSKFGGCLVHMTDTNFIKPIIAHVVPTRTLGCKPLKVGFYDKTLRYRKDTIVEWRLLFGDGNQLVRNSFDDTVYHTYLNRGDYDMRMIVTNKYGCKDTTYVTKIEVGDQITPDFTITPPGDLCASDPNATITLQSTVAPNLVQKTKFWVEGFRCLEFNAMTYKPNNKVGTFPIKMEVIDRGCISTTTRNITIKGPSALFIDTQYCDTPKKVCFTNLSQEASSYLWLFGDGQTSTLASPIHHYPMDGSYVATLIAYHASNGCPADTYRLPITIQTPVAKFTQDTYFYCHYNAAQIISAKPSSGYIDDDLHSGFIWEFKKGRGPTRTFPDTMNYDVHIKIIDTAYVSVRNFMNCISTDTALIYIDSIGIDFTVTPDTICRMDTVRYKGTLTSLLPIASQTWTFGNGRTANKLDTFQQYDFSMKTVNQFVNNFSTVTVKGCQLTTSKILIVKKLNLALDPYSTNLCLQTATVPVTLSATTNPKYVTNILWRKPDNSTSTGKTIQHNFTTTGNYNFHLIATDVSNGNCVDTLSPAQVTVHQRPSNMITSDKDALATLCDPVSLDLQLVKLIPLTLNTILWTITDSAGSTVYNNNISIARSLRKGMNKVTLITSTAYCRDTVVRNFIVRAPKGEMTIDRNDICKGEEITFTLSNMVDVTDYSIDFGDGTVESNTPVVAHKYNYVPLGGKTVAKAIFTANGNDCIGPPADTTIRIHEVYAKFSIDAGADTPICYRSVMIKDSSLGANKYFWNFGDGTTGTMKEPGMKLYPKANKFIISLNIENTTFGCKDTFLDSLELIPLPHSKATNDTICRGDTARLVQMIANQPYVTYIWTPTPFSSNLAKDTVLIKVDSSIGYQVTAFDTISRCKSESKGNITVIQPMNPQFLDTIIPPGADVLLPFSPLANYHFSWTIDSFLSCNDCKDPTAKFILSPITYKVIFYDKLKNCFTDTSVYKIDVFPDILVTAPTAFTPNGDGNNDIYYAKGYGIKKLLSFKIYNRQGTLLFYSTSEHDGWDGYYKGEPQNSDTYFYTLEAESYIPNKRVSKEGNFMLLR